MDRLKKIVLRTPAAFLCKKLPNHLQDFFARREYFAQSFLASSPGKA
jgi:hypothetical protein